MIVTLLPKIKRKNFIHSCLIVTLQIVVWIFDTFDKMLETEISFTKYLNEHCW